MPTHVSYFEKLLYGAVALSFISMFISYDTLYAEVGDAGISPQISIITKTMSLLVGVALILLAARGGKNWARWVLTLGIVESIFSGFGIISDLGIIPGGLQIVVMLMQGAAVYFVFTGDAPAWFRR